MNQCVVLYLCTAEFTGESEIEYSSAPQVGATHNCILFVMQQHSGAETDLAHKLLSKHGWGKAEIQSSKPFMPESVNSEKMQVFQRHYEECLEYGDSLVWYA